jgi:hypothetical protein
MARFKEDARDASYGALWIVIGIVFVLVLSIALWAFGVFTSDAKGTGDVIKHQNAASTREYWISKYNNDYQKLTADKANIATLGKAATAKGASAQDKQDYQGAQLVCNQDVQDYNGATQDLLGRKWLPDGLPASVNIADYCSV